MPQINCSLAVKQSGINKDQLQKFSQVSIKAANIGGEILMKNYGKISNIENKKTRWDLVTEVDVESEKNILAYLEKETPNITILAEESGLREKDHGLCWCIDPLDGTTNFAHGYPLFATSVGLTWNNIPILGSISIPFLKEIYWAAPTIGAFCNNKPIKVSSSNKLIDTLLVTGFAYDRLNVNDNNYAEFCWLTHRTRGVRRGGAAAVDLAFIASGRLDGYWERGLAKWDMAAGVPLVELAGGVVTNYPQGDFDLNNGRIFASNPQIEKELKDELNKVIPLEGNSYGDPEKKNI